MRNNQLKAQELRVEKEALEEERAAREREEAERCASCVIGARVYLERAWPARDALEGMRAACC